MGIFNKVKQTIDNGKKSVVKSKVKKLVNQKFNLNGKLDEQIDEIGDKLFEKVDVNNVIKANEIYEKLRK